MLQVLIVFKVVAVMDLANMTILTLSIPIVSVNGCQTAAKVAEIQKGALQFPTDQHLGIAGNIVVVPIHTETAKKVTSAIT